jgi:hypothetical protein
MHAGNIVEQHWIVGVDRRRPGGQSLRAVAVAQEKRRPSWSVVKRTWLAMPSAPVPPPITRMRSGPSRKLSRSIGCQRGKFMGFARKAKTSVAGRAISI